MAPILYYLHPFTLIFYFLLFFLFSILFFSYFIFYFYYFIHLLFITYIHILAGAPLSALSDRNHRKAVGRSDHVRTPVN